MALTPSRQTRFDSGEIDAALHGRDDIQQYDSAVAEMDGFVPLRGSAAMSRPGFEFLHDIGFVSSFARPRIHGVKFNNDNAILMLFGWATFGPFPYVEFYVNGVLTTAVSPVQHPYTVAELQEIDIQQNGSSVIVTHPNHEPQIYRFTSLTPLDVTRSTLSFDVAPYAGIEPLLVEPVFIGDPQHAAEQWEFWVSCLMRRPDGTVYETAAVKVERSILFNGGPGPINNNKRDPTTSRFTDIVGSTGAGGRPRGYVMAIYPDQPADIDFARDYIVGSLFVPRADEDVIVGTVVYRGKGDIRGRVGRVLGDQLATVDVGTAATDAVNATPGRFIDYGRDPDTTHQPRTGRNPFKILSPADGTTLVRLEHPSCSAYFQQRLVLGRTDERPNWIWFSAINDFNNFDEFLEPIVENALEEQLSAIGLEEVRALMPGPQALFVFTSGGVWTVAGPNGAVLSPVHSRVIEQISTVGSTRLRPLQLPNGLLYERLMGGGVRDVYFTAEGGGYASGDLSFLANHLFEGHRLDAWGYAEVPWGHVWAARDDGKLIALLYDKQRGIVGWAPQTLGDGGLARDVAVIPENGEHTTYLLTQRTIAGSAHWCLERSTTRRITDPAEARCLDACVTRSIVAGGSTGKRIQTLTHLRGRSVKINAGGVELGPFTVPDTGTLEIPFDNTPAVGTQAIVGVPFVPRLVQLDVDRDRQKDKLLQRAQVQVSASRGMFVGTPGGTMREWLQRKTGDPDVLPLFTGDVPFLVESTWGKGARFVIEQRSPFPLTVVAITREYEVSR